MADGTGMLVNADGSSYNGRWVKDKYDGYGVEKLTDGSSYEGGFAKG